MQKYKIKVVLTGAQGTGKTTLLNKMKEQGWNVITEVVRDLHKKGVNINKEGNVKGQSIIYSEYERLLNETEGPYVSDRGLTDVMAYTAYLTHYKNNEQTENLFTEQYKNWLKFTDEHPELIYFYVPIEFPAEDDGVRDTDEAYRMEIDGYIRLFFEKSGIPFITLHGSVEERMKTINEKINVINEYFDYVKDKIENKKEDDTSNN